MAMTGGSKDFTFHVPAARPDVSELCNLMLQLGSMAGRLALEERTLLNHQTGRAENVAEHAHMLARVASIIAMVHFPDLNPGIVALFATVHDDVESYVNDTSTFNASSQLLKQKAKREALGLRQLISDYRHVPAYVKLVKDYEKQILPEARFVRVVDKLLPFVVHFNQGGDTIRRKINLEVFRQANQQKSTVLLKDYPEFAMLISVRDELTELAIAEFYNPDS